MTEKARKEYVESRDSWKKLEEIPDCVAIEEMNFMGLRFRRLLVRETFQDWKTSYAEKRKAFKTEYVCRGLYVAIESEDGKRLDYYPVSKTEMLVMMKEADQPRKEAKS